MSDIDSSQTTKPEQPRIHRIARTEKKIRHGLGFTKGYNFILWFITVGALLGFTLARLQYLSFNGVFCNPKGPAGNGAAPGECYYWLQNPYKIGMKLHLYTILPASLLVCLQFVPIIRHKALLFHRLNGYIVIPLAILSSAGTLIIAKRAFGGDFATQTWVGMMVILTTLGLAMAWINIKRLQIDQHRAWMIRTWSWFGTIITIRIIMIIAAQIISMSSESDPWTTTRPCAQIASVLSQNATLASYPACSAFFDDPSSAQNLRVVVTANFASSNPMELSAALAIPFGTAGWVALVLHSIAVEVYLALTPAETNRLKRVSYERQVEKEMKRPGYAGEELEDTQPAEMKASAEPESKMDEI